MQIFESVYKYENKPIRLHTNLFLLKKRDINGLLPKDSTSKMYNKSEETTDSFIQKIQKYNIS